MKELVPEKKKIIIFFDRDDAGKKGACAVTKIPKNDSRILQYQDIIQNNIIVSFIPYKDGVTDGDFLIEDYFSWDLTVKSIVDDVLDMKKHPLKNLPNLPSRIKKEIERRLNQFKIEEFNGFIPLLEKILELSLWNEK